MWPKTVMAVVLLSLAAPVFFGPAFADAVVVEEGNTAQALQSMEGKTVLDRNREVLGVVGIVDEDGKLAELKIQTGAIVAISTDMLRTEGEKVIAPALSRGEILALTQETREQSSR